ncbi:Mannose-1-phosphate guanylyltransferase [Methanosarcina lacustris Z-7289]|uniref:Bifunctional protein GlmU n=1 Tax=Methanosarcina lacustris Z-7289 TaxID=1434111 RepID=A0A0E3S3F7_9EURY|nr:NDP-sugar synthase [Methanosarcina lacustris]AKB75474.1 Mannose-1-phosphate guanylyltransferase [Methanosarcina lacustris Z-7289]
MKACIMCGGTGTRLRPLTFKHPKPSIPILNKPSVLHLIEHLSREGFNEIVMTLGYMGERIEEQLGDGHMFGVHIDYVYEKEKMGTAGGVKNAEEYLKNEPFIVLGGDHVLNLDLREMYRFHETNDTIVTIGLLSIDDPREFGIADMDINNRIHRFLEKPKSGQIFSNLASTGIYICNPEIFDWIPENKKYDFAKDLFPALLAADKRINGMLVRGKWTDVGSSAAYRQAQRWMLDALPGTTIEGNFTTRNARIRGPLSIGNNVSIGSNSSLVGPIVIGENTVIGDNVLIGPYSVIGANCTIDNNAKILSSYLFDGVSIGKNSNISGAVVADGTAVGEECSLENGTVVGHKVAIGNNSTIHSGVKIWPEVVIEKNSSIQETVVNSNYDTTYEGS